MGAAWLWSMLPGLGGVGAGASPASLWKRPSFMNSARALPVWGSLKQRTFTPDRRACYHEDHTAIVEDLHDRDPETARERMRDHLIRVSDNLLGRH